MSRVKIHRNIVNLNGIEIFYFDTKSKGKVILCLHGRWGRAETWVDFIQQYGDKYRIIAPDQRGHGLSGKPVAKYTTEEMAADVVALLDELKIESVLLVGHSMGGSIAGYLAANYPKYVDALAILDKSAAGPDTASALPLEKLEVVDPVIQHWPLPFSSLKEARDFLRTEMNSELSYQYFMNSLMEDKDGYRMMFSTQAMAANIAYYENWFHLLPKIKCPVMLVRSSSHEAVADPDYVKMQALLSDCMAIEMSTPDHNVHLSNQQEFYGYFDKFLVESGFQA
ncbi:MAG: alpha/beta hydrolase [Anaerolineaceae bacterium]|nr:alpha/beta hydrolase [Anaerolineaceae bacterium]